MTTQLISKSEILSNITSVIYSQLGSNILEYICPESILLLKVVYIFIYFLMKDNMIIKLQDGYKEMSEIHLNKKQKIHITIRMRKFINQLYDNITNNTLHNERIYVKYRFFTKFISLSYEVFKIFYDMNLHLSNTQTYMPVILGIYIMIKTIDHCQL